MEKITKAHSFILAGTDAVPVTVECAVSPGIGIHIVGLADTAVKEALLRTVTALQACGYRIPGKKVIINIAPVASDAARGISGFDAAIAAALLAASGQEDLPLLEEAVIAGELALDGKMRAIAGCLPAADMMTPRGDTMLVVPSMTEKEAAALNRYWPGTKAYAAGSLRDLVSILRGNGDAYAVTTPADAEDGERLPEGCLSENTLRGLTIAAAGGFDVLLDTDDMQTPNALASILPDVDEKAVAMIYSAAGRPQPSRHAPLRRVHATASTMALLGGGPGTAPGEVTLAHGGVLCIDDAEMLPKTLAEALRFVHEDGAVTLKRLRTTVTMPARLTLVLRMKEAQTAHLARLEERMIRVLPGADATPVTRQRLDAARDAVAAARARQQGRGGLNATTPAADLHPGKDLEDLAGRLIAALGISAQRYSLLLRVARTIADIDGKDDVDSAALAEAAAYIIPMAKPEEVTA
jgi:magnesium chelatase family protein